MISRVFPWKFLRILKTSVSGLWARSSFKIGQNVASNKYDPTIYHILGSIFWRVFDVMPNCGAGGAVAAACTTPKCTGRSPFRAIFFPSSSKKLLIGSANLIWLVGSYSLTHSLIWPTTDLLIDMHFLILGPSIRIHVRFRFQVGYSNYSCLSNKQGDSPIVFF